ncbi:MULTISPECIES: hypothetical protein [Pseudomonas]|uniref:Uncharacterized protein n=1 Tax=Pseudomonas tohonis TaxID=2725477 RepID=A0A6J4DYZ7_9PSED|nr:MULTISPECIES: hypothetical protein [Pseudomonas]BBP81072.1 hypothetical protein PHLH8_07140 [Pseudomonas sp. Pc102]BCG22660.1 hypothetical protein TUM18999_08510 [Pseudomonas tohonis]GJN54926.1 hypothetical protein TUM20286_46780 [Pseudomonas tohonis]
MSVSGQLRMVTATRLAGESRMELLHLDYDLDTLTLQLQAPGTSTEIRVRIPAVEGFRLLDEGDLLEFWPHCSDGWLHAITAGGWFDQERLRPGFLSGDRALKEYLVSGVDRCLSVLAWEAPVILRD